MSISVNPILPVIAAQSATPDLVLQPGSVVDAQVQKLLSDTLVRIAIAGLSIDVLSEVPLQAGQTLQLAVSQMQDGIRLAIVGQGAAAGGDLVTLSPAAAVANPSSASSTPSANPLTPLEQAAVSAAARNAAAHQDSMAPLFANLGALAGSGGLPAKLQQAMMQVLAQRTSLDSSLTGSDVKNAFQKSGILLEASLASGSVAAPAGVPDLKAALIVLRQTLLSSLGTGNGQAGSATQQVAPAATVALAADAGSPLHAAASATLAPSLSPGGREILLPQARVPVAEDSLPAGSTVRIVLAETLPNAGPRAMTAAAALNLLQEALQEIPRAAGDASPATAIPKDGRNADVTVHTSTPPPPTAANAAVAARSAASAFPVEPRSSSTPCGNQTVRKRRSRRIPCQPGTRQARSFISLPRTCESSAAMREKSSS